MSQFGFNMLPMASAFGIGELPDVAKDRRFSGEAWSNDPRYEARRPDLPGADRRAAQGAGRRARSTSAARRSGASRCARSSTR